MQYCTDLVVSPGEWGHVRGSYLAFPTMITYSTSQGPKAAKCTLNAQENGHHFLGSVNQTLASFSKVSAARGRHIKMTFQNSRYRYQLGPQQYLKSPGVLPFPRCVVVPVNGHGPLWAGLVGLPRCAFAVGLLYPSSRGLSHLFSQRVLNVNIGLGLGTEQGNVTLYWGNSPTLTAPLFLHSWHTSVQISCTSA